MTEIDDEIADSMPIREEDYAFFIRALWKSNQASQNQIKQLIGVVTQIQATSTSTQKDVREIKEIFLVSGKVAAFLKYAAYVFVPIIALGWGIYTWFHRGSPQ